MQTWKKTLAHILVVTLFVMTLTACGESQSTDDGAVSGSAVTTEATVPTAKPGVPDSLKDSEYDLTKVFTEAALKDVFAKSFTVGTTINGSANANTSIRSPELSEILKYHFNSLTYSNLMKAVYLLDEKGCADKAKDGDETTVAVNFDSCKEGLDFAKENGIKMRGHVLVWHNQVPEWFFYEDYDTEKKKVSKETMCKRLESYIKQVLTFVQEEYPGVIYAWDVVNEAVAVEDGCYDAESGWNARTNYASADSQNEKNLWYDVIGPEYVEKAFEYARKYAADNVSLMYNDYNTFDNKKCEKICILLKDLKEKGLVDGIGMQTYLQLDYPSIQSGFGSVKEALGRYSDLGLEIHMSETTVRCNGNDEATQESQAERYEDLFELILAMDTDNGGPANITNVTFFGLMDEYLMYDDNKDYGWLLDDKLQPKKSFYSIQEALNTYKYFLI